MIPVQYRSTRCVEGRLFRHDPQYDDPDLETDIGQCDLCEGVGCFQADVDFSSPDEAAEYEATTVTPRGIK